MLGKAKKGKRKKKKYMRDIEAGFDCVLQGNFQEALKYFDNAIKGGYRTAQNFPDLVEMFDEKYPAEEPQQSTKVNSKEFFEFYVQAEHRLMRAIDNMDKVKNLIANFQKKWGK